MRMAHIAVPLAALAVLACSLGGCEPEEAEKTGCEADPSLCPRSVQTATDVGCDCRCVAGWSGITPTRAFTGTVQTCLPPNLNAKTASPAELDALSTGPATRRRSDS